MTDRVKDDPNLIPPDGRPPSFIKNPILIVCTSDEGKQDYHVVVQELDESGADPRAFGILMSDLLDHVAAAYSAVCGRGRRDVRAQLKKVMLDEDRFKDKDPQRGAARGATIWPRRN